MKKITLNKIREHDPCKSSYKILLKVLGKNKADDEPLSLLKILEINGLEDAIWCLRTLSWNLEARMEIAALMVLFVKPIVHLLKDEGSKNTVEIIEKFSKGEATSRELWEVSYLASAAASAASASSTSSGSAVAAAVDAAVAAAAAVAYAADAVNYAAVYSFYAADYAVDAAVDAADYAVAAFAIATASERKESRKNQVESFSAWIKENEK